MVSAEKRHEENQVCSEPIEERCDPTHCVFLLSQSLICPEDWLWTSSSTVDAAAAR